MQGKQDAAALAISRARAALILDEPFFGTLALRLKPTPVTDAEWRAKAPAGFAPTMAVDGKSLFYYPPFVESLKPEHLKFIVAHETLHLASRHHCRRGSRDDKRWNIAADFAIDPLLVKAGFVAPPSAHLDPQYAGMAAEQIYARLPQPQQGGNGGNAQPGANGGPGDEEGAPGGVWDAPAGDGAPAPSPADLRAAEEEWKAAVLQATQAAKAAGKLPGFAREFAAQIRAPQVDWREVLRHFVSQTARADYSWRKPNIRFIGGDMYLPSLHSESMGPVALFRDTSGSVGHAEHAALMAEANAIAEEVKPERVYLGSFHTRVYQMDEFEQGEPIKPSRTENGGTLFAPIWQAVDQLPEPPVCVVILTDLLPADDWPAAPSYPVLFLSTTDETAPWGQVVRLRL